MGDLRRANSRPRAIVQVRLFNQPYRDLCLLLAICASIHCWTSIDAQRADLPTSTCPGKRPAFISR